MNKIVLNQNNQELEIEWDRFEVRPELKNLLLTWGRGMIISFEYVSSVLLESLRRREFSSSY